MNYADGRGGILGLRDFRQVAPCQWSRRVAFPGSICEIEIPISSAASSVHLLRVDLSDPLVLCLWTNYFAVLNYARVLSRVSPVIYVSRALVFAQFAVCISVEVIVRGTYWVLLQFIWGGQAQRIYARDSGSQR